MEPLCSEHAHKSPGVSHGFSRGVPDTCLQRVFLCMCVCAVCCLFICLFACGLLLTATLVVVSFSCVCCAWLLDYAFRFVLPFFSKVGPIFLFFLVYCLRYCLRYVFMCVF